jgi:DNA modification methylase
MLIFGDDDPYAAIKPGRTDIRVGDCRSVLTILPDNSIDCCITSPPYYAQRDYKMADQIGLEQTPEGYVQELVNVFRAMWRVLKNDGTLWLNLGDSYARNGGSDQTVSTSAQVGSTRNSMLQRGDRTQKVPGGLKSKDLMMIPARVALALQADGWLLRSDIIWCKPNAMPESVQDRPTSSYEHVFLLTKQPHYYYDADAIREPHDSVYSRDAIAKAGCIGGERPAGNNFSKQDRYEMGELTPATRADRAALLNPKGRNARNVWTINTAPYKGAHFATMPPDLVSRCLLAGTKVGDTVLDPFGGAGTTGLVAQRLGRNAVLIELNEEYATLTRQRLGQKAPEGAFF